ncbi:hypothetical protein [Anaerostipes sp.]|uniref:hypothetical protein n=1 Tax=Anaerostipes sp. TaxID=1872530 RepID=UPI0025BE33FC|nr:hypothetical protein [Anaerostipes sp.]MBS7008877.1 hypothetical protein [Anaerostipes sp.]
MKSWRKRWAACLLACLIAAGAAGTVQTVAADDEIQYNLPEIDVEGFPDWQMANAVTDEFAPVYQPSYQTNERMVKLTVKDNGLLNIELSSWDEDETVPQASVYDGSKKLLRKTWSQYGSQYYRKTYVKAGDVFYVKVPQSKRSFRIQAAVLRNAVSVKKGPDPVTVLGEGKKCTRTFRLKKKSVVTFEYESLVKGEGTVSGYIQKKSGKAWKKTGASMKASAKTKEFTYGLRKGTYRIVFKMPKTQAVMFGYDTAVSFYNGKYGLKKSKAKDLKKILGNKAYTADQMFTKEAKKSRWYRFKKNTKQTKNLILEVKGNSGKVRFTIYKAGRKKAWKKVSLMNDAKKYKLPKGKQTYYIKVSKKGSKTNGWYEITAE